MIKVGWVGFGKAGQAVVQVLYADPEVELCWIARKSSASGTFTHRRRRHPGSGCGRRRPECLAGRAPGRRADGLFTTRVLASLWPGATPAPPDAGQRHLRLQRGRLGLRAQAGPGRAGDVLAQYHGGYQFFDHGRAPVAPRVAATRSARTMMTPLVTAVVVHAQPGRVKCIVYHVGAGVAPFSRGVQFHSLAFSAS